MWIPVEEKMPEQITDVNGNINGVLALYKKDEQPDAGFRITVCNTAYFTFHGDKHFSHWMYLPAFPEGDDDAQP